MKAKLLLALALIACTFTTYAQNNIPKGSLLLGGDLSFNSSSYKDADYNTESKSIGFSISPSVAIGVKDNLFIGLSLGYTFYKNTSSSFSSPYDSTNTRGYKAAVFVRKYKPLKNNLYLFVQGGIEGAYTNRSIENIPNRAFYQRDLNVNLSVSPGISYAINSKLQIETGFNNIFGIGYTKSAYANNLSYPGESINKNFNAYTTLNNFSSQLYFGFRLLLQKKNKPGVSSKAS